MSTTPAWVEEAVEAVARALQFDSVDQEGYPNGRATWDELLAIEGRRPISREEGLALLELRHFRQQARAALLAAVPMVERWADGQKSEAFSEGVEWGSSTIELEQAPSPTTQAGE